MSNESGKLRLEELGSGLAGFRAARSFPRPEKGWIRAMREATGVSTGELGRKLGTSRQLPLQFEKAEADDSITLKSLRRVGEALNCELVYALVPRSGAVRKPTKTRSRTQASEPLSVERIDAAVDAPAIEDENGNQYFCD
jgi:predicted DNA-binding mobile mystery protein A